MEYTIIWSDFAMVSLKGIYNFVALDNKIAAEKVVKEIFLYANTLVIFPNRNPREPLLLENKIEYRSLLKWHYKLIYYVENENVIIVSIFDSRKKPEKLLTGE